MSLSQQYRFALVGSPRVSEDVVPHEGRIIQATPTKHEEQPLPPSFLRASFAAGADHSPLIYNIDMGLEPQCMFQTRNIISFNQSADTAHVKHSVLGQVIQGTDTFPNFIGGY